MATQFTGQSRTGSFANALKIVQPDKIHDQANLKRARNFTGRFNQGVPSSVMPRGTYFEILLRMRVGSPGAHRAARQKGPKASSAVTAKGYDDFNIYRAALEIDVEALESKHATLQATKLERDNIQHAYELDMHEYGWLPPTGLRATCSATQGATATVVRVDNDRYLRPGMPVDVRLISDGTVNGIGVIDDEVVSIAAIAGSNDMNVTLRDGVATIASIGATYGLFRHGEYNLGLNGIQKIVASGDTLHNVSGVTYPEWNCQTHDAGGEAPKPEHVTALISKILDSRFGGGKPPTIIWAGRSTLNELTRQVQAMRRADIQVKQFDIWGVSSMLETGIDWCGVPIVCDPLCPPGEMYALREDMIEIVTPPNSTGKWINPILGFGGDGGTGGMLVDLEYLICNAVWVRRHQMVTYCRGAHGKITNLLYTVDGSPLT